MFHIRGKIVRFFVGLFGFFGFVDGVFDFVPALFDNGSLGRSESRNRIRKRSIGTAKLGERFSGKRLKPARRIPIRRLGRYMRFGSGSLMAFHRSVTLMFMWKSRRPRWRRFDVMADGIQNVRPGACRNRFAFRGSACRFERGPFSILRKRLSRQNNRREGAGWLRRMLFVRTGQTGRRVFRLGKLAASVRAISAITSITSASAPSKAVPVPVAATPSAEST